MTILLLIWLGLLIVLLVWVIGKPGAGGALTLAYFLGLSIIHVPGALVFLDPNAPFPGADQTEIGFRMTLLGMAAFIAGAFVAKHTNRRRVKSASDRATAAPQSLVPLGWGAFALGILCYFVFLPLSVRIPSATSLVAAIATLLIVGLWLQLYAARVLQRPILAIAVLAILPFLPLVTLAAGGFIGFGVYWALSVMTFFYVVAKRRIWFLVSMPLVTFLGLSLFVAYMGERSGIREVVWQEHADLGARLERISAMAARFEFLDLGNTSHLWALNERLNQNYLVGMGINRQRMGAVDFEYGGTVNPLALIPRALSPDKAVVGGGGNLVTDFTGIAFAPGTSVGAGQVLEFYMNFGTAGVIGGFLILGFVLMRLDHGVMRALAAGDLGSLITRAMIGLPMLQPGGNLLEIVVAVAAGYIGAQLILASTLLQNRPNAAAGIGAAMRSSGRRQPPRRT
ncbi:MAG TPA: hypothetical protein VGI30_13755 [Caulobacteraceae bacterium]